MQAIVYRKYGSPDVLELREIDRPVVGDDEVLVRIRAASVNPREWHFLRGVPYVLRLMTGLRRPKATYLGVDAAGVVEAVGSQITRFRVGDEVFGACKGAFAQYARTSEAAVALKPANLTFEQAAAVPTAALTALQGLRNAGKIETGQQVLINGAAGGVGTFAVQLAKVLGGHVTGVCSTRNVELVRSLGADEVVDYTRDDYTRGGQRYDLILDAVGNRSLSEIRRVLKPKGVLALVGGSSKGNWIGPLLPSLQALAMSKLVSQSLVPVLTRPSQEDLITLQGFLAEGKVTPVIDRTYPLREVADAIRYIEEGHARGKVVICLEP